MLLIFFHDLHTPMRMNWADMDDAEGAMRHAILGLVIVAGTVASVVLLAGTGLSAATVVAAALTALAIAPGLALLMREGA
jgi:hypothetical protein